MTIASYDPAADWVYGADHDLPPVEPFTAWEFTHAVGAPIEDYAADCHRAAVALVRSGVLGECRVARGTCPGVAGQHSWVVRGLKVYDPNAEVIDPTLWSYAPEVEGVWTGRAWERPHLPFGVGNIFQWGKPTWQGGEFVELDTSGLSNAALRFLDVLGPLDYGGWAQLAHAPVGGWPAGEIITRMAQDKRIAALIPIDIVGMVTDLNPAGLYLPDSPAPPGGIVD